MEDKSLFEKLAGLVEERTKHTELWDKLMEQKKGLTEPVRPKSFESEEQYAAYQGQLVSYKHTKDANAAAFKNWDENLKTIDRDLLNTLPHKNVWFKVKVNGESLAVGYYTDAWGGQHFIVKVTEWRDDLPELTDHVDYN